MIIAAVHKPLVQMEPVIQELQSEQMIAGQVLLVANQEIIILMPGTALLQPEQHWL